MIRRGNITRPRFSFGGQPILDIDDSSNHSTGVTLDYDEDSQSQQPSTTMSNSESGSYIHGLFVPDRPRRVQRPLTKSNHEDNINLNACLDHLFRILSRKDKEGFFQYPVTDQFAPGYSQIITRPMDFSTMKKKITQDEYSNIVEFRSDFELMCENAMKYNRPETIYWQAAKRLLATGTKLMNKEKLLSFRRSLECFSHLTERQLGFRIDSSSNHSMDESSSYLTDSLDTSINDNDQLSTMSVSQACSQRKPKLILKLPKFYDKPPVVPNEDPVAESDDIVSATGSTMLVDDYPPEEILALAEQAARCAREKLSLRSSSIPHTVSYQRDTGASSLRLTNQLDRTQQTIHLIESNYFPPLDESTSFQINTDQHSFSSLRDYLDHGPFSSQTTANETLFPELPREEVDLLIQTYGTEFSAQYAVSLMDFVRDAGDLALAYVDRFLSVLTNGEHDNFVTKKREKQKIEDTELTQPS